MIVPIALSLLFLARQLLQNIAITTPKALYQDVRSRLIIGHKRSLELDS